MKAISIRNNKENKHVSVEINFNLPYKGNPKLINTQDAYDVAKCRMHDVFGQFADHMVKALESRMEACLSNLILHKDDIIYNDGVVITYERKDKTLHSFNTPTYEIMRDAIKLIKDRDWDHLASNQMAVSQIIKGLYWVNKPEDKSGFLKYSDLISTLIDCLMLNNDDRIHRF